MQPLTSGSHTLNWGAQTYVMGILNATPDSFSGDGILATGDPLRAAMEMAARFVQAGAQMLDVGGESTRPGSEPISAEEERRRVMPIIRALVRELPEAIISVDTYKATIAQEAL